MGELTRRYAIVSDIHSNTEALGVVLDDIKSRGIEDIICLGDVVGYGPEPGPCLDMIQENCRVTLLGNHDEAVLKGAQNFNIWAREAIDWTREQLQLNGDSNDDSRRRWKYIEEMPLTFRSNGLYFVHGSPRNPTIEYILKEDITHGNYAKMEEIFASIEKVLFVGHTHTPCVITEDLDYTHPRDCEGFYAYDNKSKIIVNVGSVGQPRDSDNRSSYVEINKNEIFFHRVEYDIAAVNEKVKANERLSDNLGLRLLKGV